MGEVVYRSRVRIEKHQGPLRHATIPGRNDTVPFGVHSAIARHYGVEPEREHSTTIDYVVAATAG